MITLPVGSRVCGQAAFAFICNLGSLEFEQYQMLMEGGKAGCRGSPLAVSLNVLVMMSNRGTSTLSTLTQIC